MPEASLELSIKNEGSRNDIRMKVVDFLSKEKPGKGKDELASRYTYYVETLSNGNRIYLRRPANLHNGFDFLVCVENINFNPNGRKRNYPTHENIVKDLESKKNENPEQYKTLFSIIEKVYMCQEPNINLLDNLVFKSGYPCNLIVKTLKWFFIEQDIRYWNYSGRDMLWSGITSIN